MPAGAEPEPSCLVDTSVAVALSLTDHEHHSSTLHALTGRLLGLAGHAAFETFSVLTRLPPPARRTPATVERVLSHNFPATRFLSIEATGALLAQLPALGIAGGSVYDALIGAAAAEHELVLLTRDRRALSTYQRVDARVEVLD